MLTIIVSPAGRGNFVAHLDDADAIWRCLRWKADRNNGWQLYYGSRIVGHVVPDAKHTGMWRSTLHTGCLSDMANLPRARDAAMNAAVREIEYEHKQDAGALAVA